MAVGPQVHARLERPLPDPLAVGGGTALFLDGRCSVESASIESLRAVTAGSATTLLGWGAPPPKSRSGHDYWWTILPIEPASGPGRIPLAIEAETSHSGAAPLRAELGSLVTVPRNPPPAELDRARDLAERPSGSEPLVAVCMATYDPDPELFRRQVDSIRAQTHGNWICLISDDGSPPEAFERLVGVVAGDERFVISRAARNRGFYANFERALELVPDAVDYVALCDQDDEWHPDKLEALLAGLGTGARLVYSDMRIVDDEGAVISETYWSFRRNNHTDFGSLALANTVTGAASLFDRGLLEDVLPFPPRHAAAYHDHWIAQVAMALGPISYVDRPLYDYVQHGEAAIGYLAANGGGRYAASPLRRAQITWERFRGRRYHLGWRQPYFNIYCRVALAARVLEMRCGGRMAPDRARIVATLLEPANAARWLTRRVLEDGFGTDETLGRERLMLAGLSWDGFQRTRRRVRST